MDEINAEFDRCEKLGAGRCERDCGAAVGGLADDTDVVRAGERQAQPLTYHLVVIDNQTGNRLGHMCSTRRNTSSLEPRIGRIRRGPS